MILVSSFALFCNEIGFLWEGQYRKKVALNLGDMSFQSFPLEGNGEQENPLIMLFGSRYFKESSQKDRRLGLCWITLIYCTSLAFKQLPVLSA